MATKEKKQYGTKMEKDRAKKTYVEKRGKHIMKKRKQFKKDKPIMSKLTGALDKFTGIDTKKGVDKQLAGQFEKVYKRRGKAPFDSYNKTRTVLKAKGGMVNSKSIAKKYFKGGIV
jgi:hypothetical protein